MSDVVIRVENLGKRYRVGERKETYGTLRDTIVSAVQASMAALRGHGCKNGRKEFWALRGVSFDVKRGEVLGIVGRNGAGKSTLLKILSRVTRPTLGRAWINGRVGSLLEVGTGFHPELSGRENIFLNGAVLGMKNTEIQQKFDDIVEFAEIEQFLDTPVKRYSSGMYMRLAFSIAAHLEPEILLVDEVLAVGDAAFQKKCLGKMGKVAKEGRTVLFVSHNLQAVRSLCERGLLLSRGRSVFHGPVQDAVRHYLDYIQEGMSKRLEENPDREGDGAVRLTNTHSSDERGVARKDFVAGAPLTFNFEYVRNGRCKAVSLGFTIFNQLGIACTHINTSNVDFDLDGLGKHGHIVCCIPRNPLPVGEYRISVVVNVDDTVADYIPGCLSFRVVSSQFFQSARVQEPDLIHCPVMVDHRWHHTPD